MFWKVKRGAGDNEIEPDSEHGDGEPDRRRFVLRYFGLWTLEQCELPQAVLDRLPKLETH